VEKDGAEHSMFRYKLTMHKTLLKLLKLLVVVFLADNTMSMKTDK
jgi:hypothetical protein